LFTSFGKIFLEKVLELIKKYIFTAHSKRIAGTVRGFRITKFAQKNGLLAAFFELFLCLYVTNL